LEVSREGRWWGERERGELTSFRFDASSVERQSRPRSQNEHPPLPSRTDAHLLESSRTHETRSSSSGHRFGSGSFQRVSLFPSPSPSVPFSFALLSQLHSNPSSTLFLHLARRGSAPPPLPLLHHRNSPSSPNLLLPHLSVRSLPLLPPRLDRQLAVCPRGDLPRSGVPSRVAWSASGGARVVWVEVVLERRGRCVGGFEERDYKAGKGRSWEEVGETR